MTLENFIPHFILLIFAIILAEIAFQTAWNKSYFKKGLTVFRLKFKNYTSGNELPIQVLEKKFCGIDGFLGLPILPAINFHKIENGLYGFREKLTLTSLYWPIIRGSIEFMTEKNKIAFTGRLNYFPFILFFIILPTIFELNLPGEKAWVGMLMIYLIFLSIQTSRYVYIIVRTLYILRRQDELWPNNANSAEAKNCSAD